MLTDNTLVVFFIAGAVALLAFVQIILAVRHDRVVTAEGPAMKLSQYEQVIEQKRALMLDLEDELAKRREALAAVADIGADVDGLRRQKEELLTEWETLSEKRQEVQAVREEIEQAMTERMSLEAEIAPLREEFLAVKERLEKAETLVGRIEALTAEHEQISEKIASLQTEMVKLREAEERVKQLLDREAELELTCSRLEGRLHSQNDTMEEVSTRLSREREALAEAQSEHGKLEAQIAAEVLEERRLQGETEALREARTTLEARLAQLKAEIAQREGRPVDGDDADADKLRELREIPPVISVMEGWKPAPVENEPEALKRVERRLRAKGLEYPSRTLRAFHTAMKVNETTQMAVLAGISGTGKSQLPRQYAAGMGIGFLQVPVQPRWDSPQDLMGFYNYIEGKFRPTDMARALWALDGENNEDAIQDRMMMILLDEMNLARVEYYFSDFLSRLESRPSRSSVSDRNERKDAEIELEIPNMKKPPRIFPGYNLLFAGTMNEDESTQSLSDKVVDRANILRFAAPKKIKSSQAEGSVDEQIVLSRQTWEGWVRPVSRAESDPAVVQNLDRMVGVMRDFKKPFGHRLGRAVLAYVSNYPEVEGGDKTKDALADQVEMRLLPKLRGVDVELAGPQFAQLRSFVERDLGDDALADAIKESIDLSTETGQFVWSGVTR